MTDSTKVAPAKGSDWTRLLTDPDLVTNLGKLLQTYREVAPEKREQALLTAMREIKESAISARAAAASASGAPVAAAVKSTPFPSPQAIADTPPFEPDLFSAQAAQDRRRFARIKCFVAVELHVEGVDAPIWGNLSNVGRGGAFVETATPIPPGRSVGIGLWVANGKIWVKGVILTGIVTRSAPSFGVRVKFSEAELMEKEHLREFLKFIDSAARKGQSENAYVAKLRQ
jgi:hypothetical protein